MHRLDDLDLRILKEIGSPSSLEWNVRVTYSSVARKVGVDEETVRKSLDDVSKLVGVSTRTVERRPILLQKTNFDSSGESRRLDYFLMHAPQSYS